MQLPPFTTIEKIISVKYIDKGWSLDKKYLIETEDSKKYLLRISDAKYHEEKQKEFDVIKQIYQLGIYMSKPIEIVFDENHVYMLLTWIEGNELYDVISRLDENKQYQLGLESGKILSKIHSIKAPSKLESWYDRYSKKTHQAIKKYEDCPMKFKRDNEFVDFLQNHLDIIKYRPQTLQHGDYHVGNQILTQEGRIAIIDFNRWDYGDPWEEFNRLFIFSKEISIPYAVGQIDGYFNHQVPNDFFICSVFYTVRNTISAIPWTLIYGKNEQEMEDNIKRIDAIYHDFNGFTSYEPKWYTEFKKTR